MYRKRKITKLPPLRYFNTSISIRYEIYCATFFSCHVLNIGHRDGIPALRRSPIQVLTGPDVEQLGLSRPTRYRKATKPGHHPIVHGISLEQLHNKKPSSVAKIADRTASSN